MSAQQLMSEVDLLMSDADGVPRPDRAPSPGRAGAPGRRWVGLAVGWAFVVLAALVVVLYALTPVFQARAQHRLLGRYTKAVHEASLEATGLFGYTLPTAPPATGSSVGILEIGRMRVQMVVTEGVGPAQTENGPGHVPGTAGLGQPGNAAVVARRAAFDGPFSSLGSLRRGDPIVVTTTEGQTLYTVSQVRSVHLQSGTTPPPSLGIGAQAAASGPEAPAHLGATVATENLYGPSTDDRLTLVTSGSVLPWNTHTAIVVVATMKTLPFTATPQQSRSPSQDGAAGAGDAAAPLALAALAFAALATAAVALFRRCPRRSAYLISTPPLVVASIVLAVAVVRALPAWM